MYIIVSSIDHFYFCVHHITAYERMGSLQHYAVIMDDHTMMYLKKNNCSAKSIASPIDGSYGYFMLRKNFPFISSIDKQ